ncbi:hypothetical protein BH11PLA2_BH11PLA2_27810 [soil metagenome]
MRMWIMATLGLLVTAMALPAQTRDVIVEVDANTRALLEAAAQPPVAPPTLPVTPALPGSVPLLAPAPAPVAPPAVTMLPGTVVPATVPAQPYYTGSVPYDFAKVPKDLRSPLPRAGWFGIPPSGPGFYSVYDQLRGDWKEAAPKYPLPPFTTSSLSFFNLDYSYLDDPKYTPDFLDSLKRVRLGDHWMFSTGGQAWIRYENQYNSRLTQTDNIFTIYRARPYADLWYEDKFRFFVEGMFANSVWQDLPTGPNDTDRADFQNLFMDFKLFDYKDHPVYARVGRQEAAFGSQRLIATPDWANTRQTFDGVRVLRTGEKWDTDLFWLSPRITTNKNGPNGHDNNVNLFGAWATYKPKKGTTRDLYFIIDDNVNRVTQQGIQRFPATSYTFGGRAAGDVDGGFLYDVELAMQLGTRGKQDIVAGMATAAVGYHWADTPWNPTLWASYDYASGDHTPNGGSSANTFNQIYPFGHYYFGWIDVVGRQNIHDVSFSSWLYPTKWLTCWAQFHNFWLDSNKDALYNASGNAIRRDATGKAGNFVGNELDLIFNFHLTKRADVLTGYSYLWGGEFLQKTSSKTLAADTSLYYLGYSYRW